jgi:hypothetical protein
VIFERRAYKLRPGKLEAFWVGQETWNTKAVFGPLLERNIGYFRAVTGSLDEIVHLYRFDSLEQWQAVYQQFYAAQSPDYFKLVRPWMLRQENSFLAAPPVVSLASRWTGEKLLLPPGVDPKAPPDKMCVIETTLLLLLGGLPAYWQACEAHRLQLDAPSDANLLAELVSLVGRQHRIVRYEIFCDSSEAFERMTAQQADPSWQAFERSWSDWVADRTVTVLRPSPLASRRALLAESAG